MKTGFIFLIVSMIGGRAVNAQSTDLPARWKFTMQDDIAFKQPGYNDTQWQTVEVPAGWNALGINKEKTVGWYRVTLILPDSLLSKDLVFFAGTIDDADETYFNGNLAGSSGKFPPGDQSAWDVERKYFIPKKWVKKTNTIAIRVYNGIGDGGLYHGRLMIISKNENERLIREQVKSKKSYYQFTTSNGLIAAVYNEQSQRIENVYPHIFSYYDSGIAVKPVISNLRPAINERPLSTVYLQNTHVIEVKYPSFTLDYFASFTNENKILYVIARGREGAVKDINFTYETNAEKCTMSSGTQTREGKAEKYFLFGFSDTLNRLPDMHEALRKAMETSLQDNEIQFMRHVFAAVKIPVAVTNAERNVLEQSIAVLKMSQVADNEIFPLSHGQVLASLRPGVWAISWVRDASFAIEAMSKLGMYTEARKALEFMLNANPTNQYIHYIHTDGKDYGIGRPYVISVTRYFGNGREESDYSEGGGPNIEIDDLGLFLTAFYHYVHESGDEVFFKKWKNSIDQVRDAIVANMDETGLIRTESGPWEHHLPGKKFVWTSAVCARGLELTRLLYEPDAYALRIFDPANKLIKGIITQCLVNGKYFKGNATEQNPSDHHYFDAASFELFANGLFTDAALFKSHMKEYNLHNRAVNDPARGYIRFNSADSYENQEWPFAGLRVAVAQKNLGSKAEAKKLIGRITAYAERNNGMIPEILSNDMSMYKGAIPMVGYGAGAYIIAVLEYYKK